jgi:hypothetical protein
MQPLEGKFHHNNGSSNNGNLVNFAQKIVKEATIKDSESAIKGSRGDSFVRVCESSDRKQEQRKPYFQI